MNSPISGILLRGILSTLIGFTSFEVLNAQCSGHINLYNQTDVDSFMVHNPGCTAIEGQLNINGIDIHNLNGLSVLTRLGGLNIYVTSLTSLQGLENVTEIDGVLTFVNNEQLISIDGLHGLTSISGHIWFIDNDNLDNLAGLQNLTSVTDYVWIANNPALKNLSGLSNLTSIGTQLWIRGPNGFPDLRGLEQLTSVNNILIDFSSLQSLAGLSGLTNVPGRVTIEYNHQLLNLNGLDNLASVGKVISINDNSLLNSIEGLRSLRYVGGNADTVPYQGLILNLLPQLTNLHGLESLIEVTGRVELNSLFNLTDLTALTNLKTIGGSLIFRYDHQLTNLDGFVSLGSIGLDLEFANNIKLTSLEGFVSLNSIGHDLIIEYNQSLSACATGFICDYLRNPAGNIRIQNNSFNPQGCNSATQILERCSPLDSLFIVDANLNLGPASQSAFNDIRLKDQDTLLLIKNIRNAIAADGTSKVLLKFRFFEEGHIITPPDPPFELPWGNATYFSDGYYYGFALYSPPEFFERPENFYLFADKISAYDYEIHFEFDGQTGNKNVTATLPIVTPPVVLVHGTYSNPEKAWKTPAPGRPSMFDFLSANGYKVFTVNYEESNGTTGIFTDNSSFEDNAKVVWGNVYPSNTGGIKDALAYYRDSLKIAVTKADVIGHSLGGILPRVYASDHYNPGYERAENFMEGDISRLITIASTHCGSNLGELQTFLTGLSPFNIGALDWILVQAANFISSWVGGASPSEAVRDQLPEPVGQALELIERTEIPAHAITCKIPKGSLKDPIYDPMEEYFDLYWYITLLMYQSDDVRNAYLNSKLALVNIGLQASTTLEGGNPQKLFRGYNNLMLYKTMIEDAISRTGQVLSVMDGTFELPSEIDLFKYALGEVGMGDLADPMLQIFVAGADPVGVAAEYLLPSLQFPTPQSVLTNYLKVHEESMEGLRALIFNNDDNDGVVRVQSQAGLLDKECPDCVTHLNKIFHGFAPRYDSVQIHVLKLLHGGMKHFNLMGFPPQDTLLIYYPPASLDLFKVPLKDGAAICQSGIVPSHARAMAHIADQQNVIIITRPVNPDGTSLIAGGAATKGMDVKPKSSNWGPQRGYLPVKQRYSKLWKIFKGSERTNMIAVYDEKAQHDLSSGLAVARQLNVEACNGFFSVYIDVNKISGPEDQNAEDEVVLVPVQDPSKVCYWTNDFSPYQFIEKCEQRGAQHMLIPLEVMATPQVLEDDEVTPRFLTADYDMLMVGFYKGENQGPPMPPDLSFQPGVGQITGEQLELVNMLNAAVENTGYKGGKVVHHGPENQFSKSPYIDYPVTVFAPDEIPNGLFNRPTDGLILSIEMGPPGFRDINLKQFVNKMRKVGYDLYHNPDAPGWHWTWNASSEAYQLEDSRDLVDYVEQLPKVSCDKYGGQDKGHCPSTIEPDDANNEEKETWNPGQRSTMFASQSLLTPNPVYGSSIQFSLEPKENVSYTWSLIDAYGHMRKTQSVGINHVHTPVNVDVSTLEPGMYTILTDVYGQVGRFLKL